MSKIPRAYSLVRALAALEHPLMDTATLTAFHRVTQGRDAVIESPACASATILAGLQAAAGAGLEWEEIEQLVGAIMEKGKANYDRLQRVVEEHGGMEQLAEHIHQRQLIEKLMQAPVAGEC